VNSRAHPTVPTPVGAIRSESKDQRKLKRLRAEKKATIKPEAGLHARPAAEFAKKARQFTAEIMVSKGNKEANAKSPMKIMTLGAKKGDEVVIRAEGDDAEEAVDTLIELIS
jgi:phosphocarrier protein HPr